MVTPPRLGSVRGTTLRPPAAQGKRGGPPFHGAGGEQQPCPTFTFGISRRCGGDTPGACRPPTQSGWRGPTISAGEYNDAMSIMTERDRAAVRTEFEKLTGPVKLV